MRAVVCADFKESRIEEVPRPSPSPGEVLVAVDRVQLSITECQLYKGDSLAEIDKIRERMSENRSRLFGHEFCGVVETVGEEVQSVDEGDRVYAPAKINCEKCCYCQSGFDQLCKDKTTIGMGRPGALAEFISVPARCLRQLPAEITDAEGAAMQPAASVLLCVHDAGIRTGDVVAVIGCGVMGYQCGQIARLQGAREVVAIDVDPRKLEFARDRGMVPIHARESDPVDAVLNLTDGIGADVVFPAVGGQQQHATAGDEPLAQAFQMVRSGGTILQVGLIQSELLMEPRQLRSKSVRWINPRFGVVKVGPNTDTGELAPELVASGEISVKEFITHELSGLGEFERAVDITLQKDQYDALGPPQLVL